MTYDPSNPDDPLRHKFLDRRNFDGEFKVPVEDKIAAGLGVDPAKFVELREAGVHVERVPRRIRSLARIAGIGA